MRKGLILLSLALCCIMTTLAQTKYDAASIPKELLPYASAVVRNEEVVTEVKELNNVIYHHKKTVTVINKNGDADANVVVWYDKGRRIKFIKGTIYDEFGKPVNKFTERNFNDYSAADGFSMFVDDRYKQYQPAASNYPYTVEYEYEINARQSLNFEDWRPNQAGTAVEHSLYQFACKPDFNIRYKELNCTGSVKTGANALGFKTYTWEVNNLKALRLEPYSPAPENYLTMVKLAPEKFSYEGYTGSFTNWNEMGKWIYDKLLSNRGTLSPATVAYMHQLTDSVTNVKQKAKLIYEYMQRKTRYVSIQVGIGGYQPFTAADVDNISYGDCKGLVNYTQALLKAVNIDSYYCVVQAGDLKRSLMPDFASMAQGNHVILCLPLKSDTTWLECTSKDIPFGFLGDFTDDRYVLACTPVGGKIMRTPKYTADASKQIRKAVITLSKSGAISGSMTTTFEGWQYENRTANAGNIADEIKKSKELYNINNFEIEKLAYKPVKAIKPVNSEEITFTARDYALFEDNRFYFTPNLANRYSGVPRELRNRTTDVYINRGYTDVDNITYQIPEGYRMENEPLTVHIEKPFGHYTATAILNANNQLIYKRRLELVDGTYSKDQYQELVNFLQRVVDADAYKVMLAKAN